MHEPTDLDSQISTDPEHNTGMWREAPWRKDQAEVRGRGCSAGNCLSLKINIGKTF